MFRSVFGLVCGDNTRVSGTSHALLRLEVVLRVLRTRIMYDREKTRRRIIIIIFVGRVCTRVGGGGGGDTVEPVARAVSSRLVVADKRFPVWYNTIVRYFSYRFDIRRRVARSHPVLISKIIIITFFFFFVLSDFRRVTQRKYDKMYAASVITVRR